MPLVMLMFAVKPPAHSFWFAYVMWQLPPPPLEELDEVLGDECELDDELDEEDDCVGPLVISAYASAGSKVPAVLAQPSASPGGLTHRKASTALSPVFAVGTWPRARPPFQPSKSRSVAGRPSTCPRTPRSA